MDFTKLNPNNFIEIIPGFLIKGVSDEIFTYIHEYRYSDIDKFFAFLDVVPNNIVFPAVDDEYIENILLERNFVLAIVEDNTLEYAVYMHKDYTQHMQGLVTYFTKEVSYG